MSTSDLILHYDGICVFATSKIKPNLVAIIGLTLINLLLFAVITVFGLEGFPIPAIAFGLVEFFVIKYTLWNFFGEERLIINEVSLSYQQHFGFFTTALHTIPFHKRINIVHFDKVVQADATYVKFAFESYDKNSLPEVIYYSVLNIKEDDYKRFIQFVDRLYMDDFVSQHAMPEIHLN